MVTCYQLLDKPHRAELVVRDRLKLGESPYMLTALGDITGEAVYYEQAWSLSKGRYARAKRTLGRMAFDKQLYAECIDHLNAALAVQPLVAHAWYTKGVACMRLERWGEAVMSFTRCVQQDMEIGEAHANIGAVHMKLNNMSKAYTSFYEALKHKPDSWMLLENLLTVCLSLGRFREAVAHMNSLLDLRHKSNRPVHIDELRKLSAFVASQTWKLVHEQRRMAARDTNTELDLNAEVKDEEMPPLTLEVDRLIGKVTNAIKSNADVWDILAEFHASLGRKRSALESRYKEIRALTVDPAWAKELESVTRVLTGVEKLLDAHLSFEVFIHHIVNINFWADLTSCFLFAFAGCDQK